METSNPRTVTVDRISNSGNAIARQQHAGKTIHVPAGDVGETLEVRLIERGGYFEAKLVDRAEEITPRQPSTSPDTSDLLDTGSSSHSTTIRPSPAGGKLRAKPDGETGKNSRSRMSRRKK